MGNIFRHMGEKARRFQQMKSSLPAVLGNQAVNFFQDSFVKQGFNEGTEKWAQVKRRIPGTPEYKYPKKKGLSRRTSAILVRTGALRRDVKRGYTSFAKTIIQTSLTYASVHNRGTKKIKRRRFMGKSQILKQRQKDKIKQLLHSL